MEPNQQNPTSGPNRSPARPAKRMLVTVIALILLIFGLQGFYSMVTNDSWDVFFTVFNFALIALGIVLLFKYLFKR